MRFFQTILCPKKFFLQSVRKKKKNAKKTVELAGVVCYNKDIKNSKGA